MDRFPDLPPVWALGAALAAWALARLLPIASLPEAPGGLLIGAGLLLIVWSAWWFRRKRTPIEPNRVPRALIVEGPYRLNRNPIYTGMVLIVLGWAILLGAASALLPAVALPVVLDRRFVRGEETALRRAFGAEAEAYLRATRRW